MPRAPRAPTATPVPVLAEGTAPVSVAYRPARSAQRRAWPFVAAAGALAAIAIGAYALHAQHARRAELAARYPIVATADEAARLDADLARWRKGRARLLANLAAFDAPPLATMKGVGACTLPLAPPSAGSPTSDAAPLGAPAAVRPSDPDVALATRFVLAPHEPLADLADRARPELEHLLAAAARQRFASTAARDHVLDALAGGVLVVRITEQRAPELDRAHDTVAPGLLAGTAYAFDPATGALRCAGTFRVAGTTAVTSLSRFAGLDRASDAAIREFDAQVETALAASLRAVD